MTTADYTQWVECKNYSTSISLEKLAPTLVMAQIFGVNKIIFFSYSDINRFAKRKIYSFGEKTGKEIEIFAGNTLDELIIKNKSFTQDNIYIAYRIHIFRQQFHLNAPHIANISKRKTSVSGSGIEFYPLGLYLKRLPGDA